MSSSEPSAPPPGSDEEHGQRAVDAGYPDAPGPTAAGEGGEEVRLAETPIAVEDSTPPAEEPTQRPRRPSKPPKKRPCFHCGAMTNVRVLEKTGDLCWRCYRPVGYSLLKNLLVLAFSLLVLAGLLVSWKIYFEEEGFFTVNLTKSPQDFRPRDFSTEQKIHILKRHLLDRVPAKDLCEEFEVPPTEFARWKQQFFENAEIAFEQIQGREPSGTERRAQAMEQKIQVIEKILTDLRDHLTQLKKESGKYEATTTQRYVIESGGPPPRESK